MPRFGKKWEDSVPGTIATTSSQTPVPRPRVVSQSTPEGGRIADVSTAQLRSVVTRLAGRGVTHGVALFTALPTPPCSVLESTL